MDIGLGTAKLMTVFLVIPAEKRLQLNVPRNTRVLPLHHILNPCAALIHS
jgi:hypothetical protein